MLSSRAKIVLTAGLALFVVAQLACTLCFYEEADSLVVLYPYRMFSSPEPAVRHEVIVRLHATNGSVQRARIWNVLPTDFYKAPRYFSLAAATRGGLERLSKHVLARLNANGWPKFDETFSSVRPPEGAQFVRIDWLLVPVSYVGRSSPTIGQEHEAFSYQFDTL